MRKSNKITVIGAGNVGATIAYTLTLEGLAAEIVVIDINTEKAEGEALDIYQGTSLAHPVNIHEGTYEDSKDSDIVVITSGAARKPGQSRLDLAQINVNIMKSIAPQIYKHCPDAIYVIVSNPVDVLTYTFLKTTGIPKHQVIGTGTLLDSSRLKASLSDHFEVSANSIHAYVFGEHGDSSMIPWSMITIAGIPITKYHCVLNGREISASEEDFATFEEDVVKSGAKVIAKKGATFYAIAMSVKKVCECVLGDAKAILAVSSVIDGYCGIDDVCLSLPFIIGHNGIEGAIDPILTEEEKVKLINSANTLKDIIKQVNI